MFWHEFPATISWGQQSALAAWARSEYKVQMYAQEFEGPPAILPRYAHFLRSQCRRSLSAPFESLNELVRVENPAKQSSDHQELRLVVALAKSCPTSSAMQSASTRYE